ncbi:DUF1491 family protein [Aurantimonas sp. HBX-1]|uniref:DUF1491 family protein n=1 Tax=Aurantimonas sp. HBX-1 TaxID=2906072 RepID=UPI001F39CF40|nr:DUF1491 family protein [Aurantimonas sp. HBX-1]UIJ70651.1 DUF1491 family protein [Aurantimonas sp. HBX-1]
MRVTSDLFVAQLLRRLFADGAFAAVVRRGAEAAGAIFVVARGRSGSVRLYGPAPQSFGEEDGSRRFMAEPPMDDAAMEQRLAREARFDPDYWVVEIETDDVAAYLDIVEE